MYVNTLHKYRQRLEYISMDMYRRKKKTKRDFRYFTVINDRLMVIENRMYLHDWTHLDLMLVLV